MKDFRLTVDFAARDDAQANRLAEVIGNALDAAGIRVHAAQLDPLSPPSPRDGLFSRTDGSAAVGTARVEAPLEEDVPTGPSSRGPMQ